MKWRTVLCTALFLCGTVLLSACGGGEMPAPAEPPASSEVSAPSQPEEVPAPSESASSSEPEPPASSVPEKENPLIVNGVLKSYDTGKQKDVVLPSGKFTKIDSGCFKNNTTMESVSIPEGVTEIGFAAFSGCYNLKSVQLPKSLVKIEQSAFLDCVSLEEITFPENSRLELYQSAFENSGLLKVFIPSNIRIMNGGVFADCKKLISVYLEGQETKHLQVVILCEQSYLVRQRRKFEREHLMDVRIYRMSGMLEVGTNCFRGAIRSGMEHSLMRNTMKVLQAID